MGGVTGAANPYKISFPWQIIMPNFVALYIYNRPASFFPVCLFVPMCTLPFCRPTLTPIDALQTKFARITEYVKEMVFTELTPCRGGYVLTALCACISGHTVSKSCKISRRGEGNVPSRKGVDIKRQGFQQRDACALTAVIRKDTKLRFCLTGPFFWKSLQFQPQPHAKASRDKPLVDLITPSAAASARAGLRSAESMTVAVPRTLSSFGDRSFATAGPHAWNKLPSHLRLMKSADTFRRHLKTIFFSPGLFIMTLLGALVVLLHLRSRNLDFLDRSIDKSQKDFFYRLDALRVTQPTV